MNSDFLEWPIIDMVTLPVPEGFIQYAPNWLNVMLWRAIISVA
jgi:hypothetical protein